MSLDGLFTTGTFQFSMFVDINGVPNEVPEDPVYSPSSKCVFQRRLIEKHIMEKGTDPMSREKLSVDQLMQNCHELSMNTTPLAASLLLGYRWKLQRPKRHSGLEAQKGADATDEETGMSEADTLKQWYPNVWCPRPLLRQTFCHRPISLSWATQT
ncbi:hypothetical protein M513_09823 [Trichuris suis]|uniref:Pre-mRNA-processing factor 19 n=1 Tax=Trichuris suis TaxID=68888 RepID=A0A085LWC5_9BILA|nr:hypothetical protein M513_09823 [Trichuris suis]